MENTFSDRWKSPEFKALCRKFADDLRKIGSLHDLSADEKSELMSALADEFIEKYNIGDLYHADGNPNSCRALLGFILRSAKRMARVRDHIFAEEYPAATVTELSVALDVAVMSEAPSFTDDEVAALFEDGLLADAMCERITSGAALH